MEIILLVSGFIVGLFVGIAICKINSNKKKSAGVLRVDQSDLDGPFLFLELDNKSGMDKIMKNKKVIFDVLVEDYGTLK